MTRILHEEFEFITLSTLRKISEIDGETVVLMSSDEEFVEMYGRCPLKPVDERVALALCIEGIDAVIVDGKEVFLPEECDAYEKQYHVGYVPGTYDLLHAGHIENILYARRCCDQVVVGVNSDSLVWSNKRKKTFQTEKTRSFVLSHLKGVSLVMVIGTNDKHVVSDRIEYLLGCPMDVIILGDDLRDKDEINKVGLPEGVRIVYTRRENMERSSSTEREQVKVLTERVAALEEQNAELIEQLHQLREQVEED